MNLVFHISEDGSEKVKYNALYINKVMSILLNSAIIRFN